MTSASRSDDVSAKKKKLFVIDTNVLLSDSNSINGFQENDVLLPMIILEELDKLKTRQDERGVNARATVRKLEQLRLIGSLRHGVHLDSGGTLMVCSVEPGWFDQIPTEFARDKADNVILATAFKYHTDNLRKKDACKYEDVILITRDVNLRLKCDAVGVKTQDYKNVKVTDESRGVYSGVADVVIEPEAYHSVCNKKPACEAFDASAHGVFPNEFIRLKFEDSPEDVIETVRFISSELPFQKVTKHEVFGLKTKNREQEFALELLLDSTVDLVTMTGPAGCGKTLLAVAAAFEQLVKLGKYATYDRLIVSRSVQPMGKDVGFLPGTLQEKMAPWIAPVMDSIAFLRGSEKDKCKSKTSETGDLYIDTLMEKGIISVEALTFIRGRSIPKTIMLVDECQNLSVHELKTIVTRMGHGSKLILTGDLEQIDNSQVDMYSNGLTYAIEKFKECPFAGHVNLVKGERSQLATYAARVL